MEQYLKLTPDDGELLKNPIKYRRLVGRLIYLTVTRPDIAFSVRNLSQYIHDPRKPHWDTAIRVLKYIKGSLGQGLLLPSENNLTLTAYCDSDWGGCQTTRRSVSHGSPKNRQTYQDHQRKQNTARNVQHLFGDSLVVISVAGFKGAM